MSSNVWSISIRLKRPPCIAAQKHCGQVKPLLQFEILSAIPEPPRRPASLNPEQKGCRELFPIHSVTALRNAFCRTEPDDNCLAILSTAVSRRQPARMSRASLAGGVDA